MANLESGTYTANDLRFYTQVATDLGERYVVAHALRAKNRPCYCPAVNAGVHHHRRTARGHLQNHPIRLLLLRANLPRPRLLHHPQAHRRLHLLCLPQTTLGKSQREVPRVRSEGVAAWRPSCSGRGRRRGGTEMDARGPVPARQQRCGGNRPDVRGLPTVVLLCRMNVSMHEYVAVSTRPSMPPTTGPRTASSHGVQELGLLQHNRVGRADGAD